MEEQEGDVPRRAINNDTIRGKKAAKLVASFLQFKLFSVFSEVFSQKDLKKYETSERQRMCKVCVLQVTYNQKSFFFLISMEIY